jgi:hypothetical protein
MGGQVAEFHVGRADNGEELLYLNPDYQDLFGFVSGSVVICEVGMKARIQVPGSRFASFAHVREGDVPRSERRAPWIWIQVRVRIRCCPLDQFPLEGSFQTGAW